MDNWLKTHLRGDMVIWGIVVVLSVLSTLIVYSATGSLAYRQMQGNTEYYLFKHLSLVIISIISIWVTHKIDYRYYAGLTKLGLWISIPLLLFTWKYGSNINEASRWITIPIINKTFQPSDLAQFCLIVQLSNLISKNQKNINSLKKSFIPVAFWSSLISGLVALTNLSNAILIFVTSLLLMYIGRISLKNILLFLLVGVFAGCISISLGQRGKTATSRIKSFFKGDLSFQTEQSYIAIASGKIYGKGPGNSCQRNFLPHPYSDFIYAILAEEYGIVGCIFVIFLYLLLLYRSISLITRLKSTYAILMAVGLSLIITIQAILNMSVAVGIIPVTGLTLPFLSWGGTSLLFTGITIGAIISVSRGEIDKTIITKNKNLYNTYKKNNLQPE